MAAKAVKNLEKRTFYENKTGIWDKQMSNGIFLSARIKEKLITIQGRKNEINIFSSSQNILIWINIYI